MTLCNLVGGYQFFEEPSASIFKAEVRQVRNVANDKEMQEKLGHGRLEWPIREGMEPKGRWMHIAKNKKIIYEFEH
jgi:hypothetical protein